MQLNRKLLQIIGKRIPAIYDLIPRGPQTRLYWSMPRPQPLPEIALNPQPIPPHELGAAVADEFVRSAWLAARNGLDIKYVFEDLDDWCPTRPQKLKLPPWWPIPIPEPEPGPDWFVDYHLGFAVRLAAAVADANETMRAPLDKAIDRSLASIEAMA